MLILNEAEYAKNIYEGRSTEVKSIVSQVRYIVRYLIHTLNKNDDEVYLCVIEWMNRYCDNFSENCYEQLISDIIKKSRKQPFYQIKNIEVTQSELNAISSLENLRAEKVLFVLLCMAKQQSVAAGFTNGLVMYSITSLCKMARISVPAEQREYILNYIVQKGLLKCPQKNNSKCLFVNCIDNNSPIVLKLDEIDCQELAYVYLNWKNDGKGYSRCEFCNRPIKQIKGKSQRFCEQCADIIGEVSDDKKIITCVDCGEIVPISKFNNETCRCDTCQYIKNKELTRERVRRYREKQNL